MKNKSTRLASALRIGLVFLLLLAEYRGFSGPLPPDKLAFVGLWKTSTGYGLDFSTNGTVRITEDYNWQEIPGWFTVFQRDWNEDNVPVAGGTNFSATVWDVEFQNDDFLLIYGQRRPTAVTKSTSTLGRKPTRRKWF